MKVRIRVPKPQRNWSIGTFEFAAFFGMTSWMVVYYCITGHIQWHAGLLSFIPRSIVDSVFLPFAINMMANIGGRHTEHGLSSWIKWYMAIAITSSILWGSVYGLFFVLAAALINTLLRDHGHA